MKKREEMLAKMAEREATVRQLAGMEAALRARSVEGLEQWVRQYERRRSAAHDYLSAACIAAVMFFASGMADYVLLHQPTAYGTEGLQVASQRVYNMMEMA